MPRDNVSTPWQDSQQYRGATTAKRVGTRAAVGVVIGGNCRWRQRGGDWRRCGQRCASDDQGRTSSRAECNFARIRIAAGGATARRGYQLTGSTVAGTSCCGLVRNWKSPSRLCGFVDDCYDFTFNFISEACHSIQARGLKERRWPDGCDRTALVLAKNGDAARQHR